MMSTDSRLQGSSDRGNKENREGNLHGAVHDGDNGRDARQKGGEHAGANVERSPQTSREPPRGDGRRKPEDHLQAPDSDLNDGPGSDGRAGGFEKGPDRTSKAGRKDSHSQTQHR